MELLKYSFEGITAKEYKQILHNNINNNLYLKLKRANTLNDEDLVQTLKESGVNYITINDIQYPTLLKEIYDPPYILYYKGDLSILNNKILSIVGSRNATQYSREVLNLIIPKLDSYTICSGLAYGADEMAHSISIRHGMNTIGVLAFGHHLHYPKTTFKLRQQIEKDNLTISEFPPFSPIEKWKFVSRNRIIAGLSIGVIITEADINSGSLVTGEMALNENRHVFSIPGNITSKYSRGTNQLLNEGATIVLNANSIIQEIEQCF